jgi:uncharacterized protein YbjT (DUF2867 family)
MMQTSTIMGKTATVIGATGMIGSQLVEQLLADPYYETVRILIRRPIEQAHPKLEKKLVDFEDSDSLLIALTDSDAIFCAIGTTNKKVKDDQTAYRKIDFDIPLRIAKLGKMVGCENFSIVTAVGANEKSRAFYIRLKGEVEKAIKNIGLNSVNIMRPSMLLGSRNESRPMEGFLQSATRAASFLIPSKFKPIEGRDVASAMIEASKRNKQGFFIYHFKEMMELIAKN